MTYSAVVRDYIALVENFEATSESIRHLDDKEKERVRGELIAEATSHLARYAADDFEKLMVWHTDKLYRVLNAVPLLDGASFVFLRALGAAFGAAAKQRATAIAYLVDNGVPEDRLRGVHAAFSALGFVVASPELLAVALGEADGVAPDEVLGPRLETYRAEAIAVAGRVFASALADRRSCIWLSGACDEDDLRAVAGSLDGLPYVGVFRNDAPVDGTKVQVFRARGKSDPLAF